MKRQRPEFKELPREYTFHLNKFLSLIKDGTEALQE